jgi:hypothetical protein
VGETHPTQRRQHRKHQKMMLLHLPMPLVGIQVP